MRSSYLVLLETEAFVFTFGGFSLMMMVGVCGSTQSCWFKSQDWLIKWRQMRSKKWHFRSPSAKILTKCTWTAHWTPNHSWCEYVEMNVHTKSISKVNNMSEQGHVQFRSGCLLIKTSDCLKCNSCLKYTWGRKSGCLLFPSQILTSESSRQIA